MRGIVIIILALLVSAAAHAQPATYAVVCTAPCVAPDGTTQPAGTTLNFVRWDPAVPWLPADAAGNPALVHAVPFAGQTIYAPPVPVATIIPGIVLWNRMVTGEQTGFENYVIAHPMALPTFVQIITGTIDLTSPVTASWFAFMVTAGLITSQRATIVLTPTNTGL
jgi:hypothetical protein